MVDEYHTIDAFLDININCNITLYVSKAFIQYMMQSNEITRDVELNFNNCLISACANLICATAV